MKRHYRHGFCHGFGFPPFGPHVWRPWGRRPWGFGFPRREDYLHMLQEYRDQLKEIQDEIAEELKEVEQEIEKLKS